MKPDCTEISVAARQTQLPVLLAWLEERTRQAELGHLPAHRLQLVVEELFANTLEHGYGRECDQPVHLAFAACDNRILLRYRDAAPAFDPTTPPVRDHDRPGGFGLTVVRDMAARMTYCRTPQGNETELEFRF